MIAPSRDIAARRTAERLAWAIGLVLLALFAVRSVTPHMILPF